MRALVGAAAVCVLALAARAETVRGYVTDRKARVQAQVRVLGQVGNDGGWSPCAREVNTFRRNLDERGPWVLAETSTNDAGEFDLAFEPAPFCTVQIVVDGFRPFSLLPTAPAPTLRPAARGLHRR
jgi:hypothetical protein